MSDALFTALPAHQGHFLLESGLHTDCWVTLDAMLVDLARVSPLLDALADRLRGHHVTAVCGPLHGGAFLAQAIAQRLGARFYYSVPEPPTGGDAAHLFHARYSLPAAQARLVAGERVAVVDDAVSAGSSVRATAAVLAEAGATVVVIGTPLLLGDVGARHFAERDIPIEALDRQPLALWPPAECPLCARGVPLDSTTDAMNVVP